MKKFFTLLLACLLTAKITVAQVGLSCQYFPGAQFGFVSIKTPNYGKYRYSAGLPLLMIDRFKKHFYFNMDFSAFYYTVTKYNQASDNLVKISKAEGPVSTFRFGYLWGESDDFRMGGSINCGLNASNLDSLPNPMDHVFKGKRTYLNYGLGLVAYNKIGKIRTMAKLGYELYRRKGLLNGGSGIYFEGTVAYAFYDNYGLSVMPCFYSKKLNYKPLPKGGPKRDEELPEGEAKVRSMVLKIGITKFF